MHQPQKDALAKETVEEFYNRFWKPLIEAGLAYQCTVKEYDPQFYEGMKGVARRNKEPFRKYIPPINKKGDELYKKINGLDIAELKPDELRKIAYRKGKRLVI